MLIEAATFAALAAAGTALARRYALGRALLDQPGERRSHAVPTPRGGGIAIVAAVLVATLWAIGRGDVPAASGIAFATGLCAIALVGWLDDHRPLSAALRFAVHVAAGGGVAAALGWQSGDWAVAAVAFVAALVLTNVWNFMDGINGIAASQGLLMAAALSLDVAGGWTLIAVAIAAGCAGFLPFNFPRAHIFMGDVGSGALGFALAVLATASIRGAGTGAAVIAVMAASAFLIDAGLTLARRMLRGERWWTPHTQHAYQACARRWGHAGVTFCYCGWTVVSVLITRRLIDAAAPLLVTGGVVIAWYTSGVALWLWLQHFDSSRARTDPAATKD